MAWGYGNVNHATVRAVAVVPVDGTAIQVRISNRFGNAPLSISSATVGRSAGGAAVAPGSLLPLRFSNALSVTVPVGSSVVSDPVGLAVTAPEPLAVSMSVSGSNLITAHYPCCEAQTPSYLSAPGSGDLTRQANSLGYGYAASFSRLLDAVDVERSPGPPGAPAARGSIVVVGDSITDGFNSKARWTDALQQRISRLPMAERPAVINEGITANALTAVEPSDAALGGGPPGVQRVTQDALDLPGVATVVLFLGTNDLYFGAQASAVIAGMQQVATMAHQAKVRVVGVTLLPRAGSEGWNPQRQVDLIQVNQWLASSNAFDGVLNLAPSVANVYDGMCDPGAMYVPYDSGDHLHPNSAGATAIADAVSPPALSLPPLPVVSPLVAATPTGGCATASDGAAPAKPRQSSR